MSSRPQPDSTRTLLAVSVPLMIAVAGFVGFISISMVPLSPAGDLFDLSQRVKEARSSTPSVEKARTLDRAAANLEAARQAIKIESEKPWTLRSYDRARSILWKAELLVERAAANAPNSGAHQTVPAG